MLDLWYEIPTAERIEIASRGVRGVPLFAGDMGLGPATGSDSREVRETLAPHPRAWKRPRTWPAGGDPPEGCSSVPAIDANDDADGGGFAHPV